MSRAFSVSLAAMMLILSVVSPGQQFALAGESTPDPALTSEDPGLEVTTESEAVVEEPTEPVAGPPVEEAGVPKNEGQLVPVGEPTETANSPPADDEPAVAEDNEPVQDEQPVAQENDTESETSGESEELVISPNAVNPIPDPGCSLEDACPGGSEEMVTVTITVNDTDSVAVHGATVVIKTGLTGDILLSRSTDSNGLVSTSLIAGESYFVSAGSNLHLTSSQSITPTSGETTFTLVLEPGPELSGHITIAISNNRNQKVADAEIVVWNTANYFEPVATGTTNANGVFQISSLPAGTYQVEVRARSHQYSHSTEFTHQGGGAYVPITLNRYADGAFTLTVLDDQTGDPVRGATVVITDDLYVQQATGTTNSSGTWTSAQLTGGIWYSYTITAPNYQVFTSGIFWINGDTDDQKWLVPQQGALKPIGVTVVNRSGQPVVNANVRVISNEALVHEFTTDSNGEGSSRDLPTGVYGITVSADGHATTTRSIDTTRDEHLTLTLEDDQLRPINVFVVDDVTGEPVPDTNLFLSNLAGDGDEGALDADGTWTSPSLPSGTYVLDVWSDGYASQTLYINHPAGDTVFVRLQRPGNGTVTLQVIDHGTEFEIAKAIVSVTDSRNNLVEWGYTDENGTYTTLLLTGTDYTFTVSAEGYGMDSRELGVGTGESFYVFRMNRMEDAGGIGVKVKTQFDEPRESVLVTLYHKGAVVGRGYTDDDGFWESGELPPGTYEYHVYKYGYGSRTGSYVKPNNGTSGVDVILARAGMFPKATLTIRKSSSSTQSNTTLMLPAAGINPGLSSFLAQVPQDTEPLSGVTVGLVDLHTLDTIATGVTNENGEVTFNDIYAGTYLVEIDGFETQTVDLSETPDAGVLMVPAGQTDPEDGSDPGEEPNPNPGDPGGDNGDGNSGNPNPDPGDPGDGTNPDPDDPDDSSVPAPGNPDPGTPDDGTSPDPDDPDGSSNPSPENPDPGIPDDGSNPGPDNPDDSSNPAPDNPEPGTPDDGSSPDPDDPDGSSDPAPDNPEPGAPDDGSNQGPVNSGDGSNPDAGNLDESVNPGRGDSGEGTTPRIDRPGPVVDSEPGLEPVGRSGDSIATAPLAQSSELASADSHVTANAGAVNELPVTGIGAARVHLMLIVLTLLAGTSLLGGIAIRRR